MAKSKILIKIEKEIKDLDRIADELYNERSRVLAKLDILIKLLKD
jgi:hypothetical protein